jgi:t-SNARE complex subunit (syntaxin)
MMPDGETMEVKIARIDENVKAIKRDIESMKMNCARDMADHENRIRDNEKFKQRGYGALGIISAILTIVTIIVGRLLFG